jgi:2'-5' RNA ligase
VPPMPPLYTLAYPLLSQADRAFIDSYRSEHDAAFRDVVAPHFTMLFGCDQIAESQYKEHVRSVAARSKPVSFVCRYAMVCNDVSNENFYVFLVPDEGYSALSLLHDELYRGPLAPFLRLDAPYVPHVAVATSQDSKHIKDLCDSLNKGGLSMAGSVDRLTMCSLVDGKIRDDHVLPLLGR